jgi:hypothetical protein
VGCDAVLPHQRRWPPLSSRSHWSSELGTALLHGDKKQGKGGSLTSGRGCMAALAVKHSHLCVPLRSRGLPDVRAFDAPCRRENLGGNSLTLAPAYALRCRDGRKSPHAYLFTCAGCVLMRMSYRVKMRVCNSLHRPLRVALGHLYRRIEMT